MASRQVKAPQNQTLLRLRSRVYEIRPHESDCVSFVRGNTMSRKARMIASTIRFWYVKVLFRTCYSFLRLKFYDSYINRGSQITVKVSNYMGRQKKKMKSRCFLLCISWCSISRVGVGVSNTTLAGSRI